MNPRLLLWSTVNRLSISGKAIGPEQRVSVMEVLRAITIDAAWQIHREQEIGSIELGKLADLLVLNGAPRTNSAAIRELQLERSLVNGITIYP